jgi:2-oxoisovalerate dehydrogenase E2 component (dihydrolipoyl transacylase)
VRRYQFRLADVGEGIAEAEIAAWHVAAGDQVEEDQALVDVMTEKVTVAISSPLSGVVLAIHGEVGKNVPVGSVLVELEVEDDTGKPAAPEHVIGAAEDLPVARENPSSSQGIPPSSMPPPRSTLAQAPLASPSTRRRARELGIELESVLGTGLNGRITPQDIDRHVAPGAVAARSPSERRTAVHETKIIGLRRKIAEKMLEATRRIPHFSYIEEFDLTELEALRREINAERSADQSKLTPLPFFMCALVRLMSEFPHLNAHYDDEAGVLRSYDAVHIGIATQSDSGLLVPVVRHAESLDLWGCAREMLRVTTAARAGRATREELTGSTITLTSLGALGGIAATPIINHPEVAIIGPNKLAERAVVLNGAMVIRTMINVSSSFDHRIVDGHLAARFVQRLKRLIERPALMFLESDQGGK